MTVFLLENMKLIMLFALIGTLIGLSHFGRENRNGFGLTAARRTHGSPRARRILAVSIRLAAAADRLSSARQHSIRVQRRLLKPSFG